MGAAGVVLLVGALLAGDAVGVGAQEGARFQELDVSLWPEYDRPSVLVMYRGTLGPETAVPATVTLRIPAAVGAPSAVAEGRPDGGLVNASYERRVDGDWALLTIEATQPRLQVEYYDPRLQRQESRRSFEYRWPGMSGVGELEITVQEPVGARELVVDPAPDRRGEAADGLVYHTVSVPAAAEPTMVRVEYTKDTDALSVESLQPVTPPNPTAPGSSPATRVPAGDEVPVWLVLLVALAAVGGGLGWWFLSRRRPPGAGDLSADGPGEAPSDGRSGAAGTERRFCTQCGGGVGPEDRFCASCGRRLTG